MGTIVAIGGGEIGIEGKPVETTAIDTEIIRLSGKKLPNLLFIPTASLDSELYADAVVKQFGKRLGCKTDVLYVIKEKPEYREISRKILSSDIIYLGGGNTLKMMRIWRRLGVDDLLKSAYEQGTVMSGISAGAICWFKYGDSDSMRYSNPEAGLIRVRGLGLVNALFCPHYDSEKDRAPHLKKIVKKTHGISVAVPDCCAIEVIDNRYRLIKSKENAVAYRVYRHRGKFVEEEIRYTKEFAPMANLLNKAKK